MQGSAHQVLKVERAIKPDAHTVGAVNGTGIDTEGFEELLCMVDVGTIGTSVDLKLQESSDDGSSDTYADITGASITQITASDKQAAIRLNLRGRERYIRAVLTAGGTEDAAAFFVLSEFKYPPVTQSVDETKSVNS